MESVNEIYYLRFDYMKNLKLSRRGYLIGKFVFSNHMETSGEKANSDLFVHELECSDQVICLQNMYSPLYRWKNTATVQKLFADYTAMPRVTHGDKLSDKTNNGLDLEPVLESGFRVSIWSWISSQDFELGFRVRGCSPFTKCFRKISPVGK